VVYLCNGCRHSVGGELFTFRKNWGTYFFDNVVGVGNDFRCCFNWYLCLFHNTENGCGSIVDEPPIDALTLIELVVMILANVAIVLSIQSKNATTAGLIELSYPLFTILFTWVLFHEHHLNMATVIGSILISLGVICVGFAG